jgi:hypothetical protein
MTITPWNDPAFDPIRSALVQRMLALGWENATAERADKMMRGWDYFTDNSVDDRGHLTCYDWMDPGIVRLLDRALHLYYGVEQLPRLA